MTSLYALCCLFSSLFLLCFLAETEAENNGVYIVYMGAASSPSGTPRDDHLLLLSSLQRRKREAVVQNYKYGFSGFAARLTKEEAFSMAKEPGVVSVFPDPLLQLHTTRSWDFLQYETGLEIDLNPTSSGSSNSTAQAPSETIIGILDTGIWPESESFKDNGIGQVPSKWKGTCMESNDFPSSKCNRKLIGARYYKGLDETGDASNNTARDMNGHGTHVASTAAGNPVMGASYYGLAAGTAKGGSPSSRIAMYRVCGEGGCRGSNIMAAFDDAIKDGVDVLSLSLGAASGYAPTFSSDPIAIGSFHAVEKGIIVVCSAGNDGPDRKTVVNVAPWILTVAATTIDRDFQADIKLGNNKVIQGGGINFGNIQKSPTYPLIHGSSAKGNSSDEDDARNCVPDSLDGNKVKGTIILCENEDGLYPVRAKLAGVKELGGIGMILVENDARSVASTYGSFPMATVTSEDGSEILSYINTTRDPVATILPTITVTNYQPAPIVPYFSARGPSFATGNILKPDVAAPGVDILAAWPGNDSSVTLSGKEPPLFYVLSGTSMACPHVSGVAAAIKSQNPNWAPSAIRSAIMTTASQTNNLKKPITTNTGSVATPYDYGAGEVSTSGTAQPGLVYETEISEYLFFLCNIGYNISTIKLISSNIPDGFSCPSNSNANLISNMNYPSIAISNFGGRGSRQINRTVTHVGDDDSPYTVTVDTPTGLEVKVVPDKLQFTQSNTKQTYQVIFISNSGLPEKDLFGSITWSNGKYRVRSPFVVSSN